MSALILPNDIILNIFLRLPDKDLKQVRCVCKPWCKLSSSHDFVTMHLNRAIENNNLDLLILTPNEQIYSSVGFDPSTSYLSTCYKASEMDYPLKYPDSLLEILGSCNGLVCIIDHQHKEICLWNPYTKEYKMLPRSESFPCLDSIIYGFGYDCKSEDYKLVRIKHDFDEVKVYSLRSNYWKIVKKSVPKMVLKGPPVFINGALHWIAYGVLNTVVVSFDIGDETFKDVQLPEHLDNNRIQEIGSLGGCLCMLRKFSNGDSEVWAMKDYGVRESWTKLFTIKRSVIQPFSQLDLIQSFENGQILLQGDKENLVLYDPNNERARILMFPGVPDRSITTVSYVRSLVSPRPSTYTKKPKKSKKKKAKGKKNKKR